MNWWLIQGVGFLAWLVWLLSYWNKSKKKILLWQVGSGMLYVLHYLLLSAKSGVLMQLIGVFREMGFYFAKTDKQEKLIFWLLLPIYLIIGFITSEGMISILPLVASIVVCYTMTKSSRHIVWGGIVDGICWFIYCIFSHSFSGLVTNSFVICSNSLVLLKSTTSKR